MSKRLVKLGAIGLLAYGCGGSSPPPAPTAPSPPDHQFFSAGTYALTLHGFDIVGDPTYQPCTPLAAPPEGKQVTVFGVLRQESNGFVFEATGGIVLRFSTEGSGNTVGTIAGQGRDQPTGVAPVRDLEVRVDGQSSPWALLEGAAKRSGGGELFGRVTGRTTFSNSRGASAQCPTVQAFLRIGVPSS